METEKLSFKLDVFEGPLDLLLHLIAKDKVDIYDIPIESITRQYFAYLNTVKEFDMEVGSEFLVMAARLLYIKSKMLLPQEKIETEDKVDPRAELVAKLLDYKAYKDLAEFLRQKEHDGDEFFYRSREKFNFSNLDYHNQSFDLSELTQAFYDVVSRKKEAEVVKTNNAESMQSITKRRIYSVTDKVYEIKDFIEENGPTLFRRMFDNIEEKSECIAMFLAILEMVKSSLLQIEYSYEDIDFILKDGVINE